jgi:hypothetical protein
MKLIKTSTILMICLLAGIIIFPVAGDTAKNCYYYSDKGNNLSNFMYKEIDLQDYSSAYLIFSSKYDIRPGDFVFVYFSKNNEKLEGWYYSGYQENWTIKMEDLSSLLGSQGYIGFYYSTNATGIGDGFCVDDIQIYADDNTIFFDNCQNESGQWTLNGFIHKSEVETISIGSAIVDVNDTIMLPITIENAVDIQQISLDLVYDPDVVSMLDVTANDTIPLSNVIYTLDTGTVSIELTNPDKITLTANTPLIDITFKTGENTGATSLKLQNIELVNNTGSHIPDTVINGSITVCIKGDFNDNDRVDIGDAANVAFMVAEKIKQDIRADFNHNGCVDIGDAAKISFYLAKKVNEL